MKFEAGLYTDSAETDQPEGTYRFAKNMVDSNTMGAKENEKSFLELDWDTPYDTIGIIPINEGFVVFSTDNTDSEIGTWVNGVYTTVYNDPDLNFDTDAPIMGEYRIETTGDRVITWIDDINVPRILNIDDLSGVNSVNDLEIFQDINNPTLSAYSIGDSGGSLPTAAYIVITRYRGLDGSTTNWYVHDKTFYINDEPKTGSFQNNDGAPALTASNKLINITLSDCDTNFDEIEIGFIRIANQITEAFIASKRAVASTVNTAITGSESLTTIAVAEVLVANSVYSNAKAITQVNNQLVLANLTSREAPNFQPYATAIQLNYTTTTLNVINNVGTHKDALPQTLMPGDVYAFYIGLELNKGGWVFYHIPGRPEIVGDKTAIVEPDGLSYLQYQVGNTADMTGSGATTNMGFWENTTETYPNDDIYDGSGVGGLDLRGQLVRHHRLPTVTQLESTTYSADLTVGTTNLVRLGVNASNVNIPSDIQSQVKRWKIFFAKKSAANSIVGGSDLLHYPVSPVTSPATYTTTGGNWTSILELAVTAPVRTDAILGHSLDHLFSNEFTPDFAWFHYGLRTDNINTDYSGFRGPGSRLSVTGLQRGGTAGVVIDYTAQTTTKVAAAQIRLLNNYRFVAQNTIDGKFRSAYSEGFYVADITALSALPGGLLAAFPALTLRNLTSASVDNQFSGANLGEDTIFMQYGKIVANAHTSFTAQELVPMEGEAEPADTFLNGITGGDTFLCWMSYLAAAPLHATLQSTLPDPAHQGVKAWKAYVGYSRRNWNYRHQTQGNTSTYYYGKTGPETLYSPILALPVNLATQATVNTLLSAFNGFNEINYNEDYSTMNIFTVGVTYSPDIVNVTEFPNLIIYSATQGTESQDVSWRIFPAGNRYTMPKNKGPIINVQGINNRDLLIHTKYSLYRTRTNVGMETADGEEVNLKSNELFAITPEELVSTSEAYAGTQNKFACKLTKVGYAFVDDLQGKIFLLSEKLEEISSNGMRQFFRDNMNVRSDNPFNDEGYTMSYDEHINRLIITKKQEDTPWTVSYNPVKKVWVSFHDYTPDYIFALVDNTLLSLKDNRLYQHNTTGARGLFYTGILYPSMIDVVFNNESVKDKVFTELAWLSESYDNSGVLQYTDALTHLTFRSLDHCTDRVQLSLFDAIDTLYTSNIRNLNRVWYFNDIRDIALQPGFTFGFYQNYALDSTKLDTNMSWFDQRKFTDKFVICRHEYDNTTGYKFLLLSSDLNYRYAVK